MAETVGTDFLLKNATNTVGGKDGATLNLERDSAELAPTQTTGVNYARSLVGLKDWSIDYDALWIADSSALNGFAPTVTIDPGGTSPVDLKFISEVTITLERDLIEFANTANSEYISRQPSIVRASMEVTTDVEASSHYTSSEASTQLIDAWDSTDGKLDVELQLPNNNTSFNATWSVPSVEFDAPSADATETVYTLESSGTITETINANLGSGLNEILTNIFANSPSSFTSILTTANTGSVEFSGPVFPSEIEITIPVEGSEDGINTSGSLMGAGAITIQETP
jgi:predicted secreted protein